MRKPNSIIPKGSPIGIHVPTGQMLWEVHLRGMSYCELIEDVQLTEDIPGYTGLKDYYINSGHFNCEPELYNPNSGTEIRPSPIEPELNKLNDHITTQSSDTRYNTITDYMNNIMPDGSLRFTWNGKIKTADHHLPYGMITGIDTNNDILYGARMAYESLPISAPKTRRKTPTLNFNN